MPKVDPKSIAESRGSYYPAPFDNEPELLCVGECAALPRNSPVGHHLFNKSARTAIRLEVGARMAGDTTYPDIDIVLDPKTNRYVHKVNTASSRRHTP
jgi:uncharacterized cupin superfamily protein